MKIQRGSERHHRQLKSPKTGEDYSLSSVVSEALKSKDLFISHEIIASGAKSSAAHFHTETDEVIYILKGSLTAVEGDIETVLNEGDVICFEANSGLGHYLKNNSGHDAYALVVRREVAKTDVIYSEI